MQSLSPHALPLNSSGSEAMASFATAQVDTARRVLAEGRSEEAADSFEKLLATMFVKEMRRALPEGFFGDGAGSDVYSAWLDENLGAALAERDSLGFAAMVKEDLIRINAAREAEAQ